MRVAVVGHLEWVEFVGVDRVPVAGDIVQGTPIMELAAGGGAVAAVALARWGADVSFFTAFGNDALGKRSEEELLARGVKLRAVVREEPQRRAVTLVDAHRERTIVVIGERHVPRASDALPWHELEACDAVYFTGGEAQLARAARVMVATSRVISQLRGVDLDALVGSANDPAERYDNDLVPPPHVVVRTNGAHGGTYTENGSTSTFAAVPAVVTGDTYGAGDTFAAALTFALGEGRDAKAAVDFAAARAAEVLAWRGPYPPR